MSSGFLPKILPLRVWAAEVYEIDGFYPFLRMISDDNMFTYHFLISQKCTRHRSLRMFIKTSANEILGIYAYINSKSLWWSYACLKKFEINSYKRWRSSNGKHKTTQNSWRETERIEGSETKIKMHLSKLNEMAKGLGEFIHLWSHKTWGCIISQLNMNTLYSWVMTQIPALLCVYWLQST